MRFGTVDGFLALSSDDLRLGRNVANHEFILALLRYGTFDAYHFFLPDLAWMDAFRHRLALCIPEAHLRARVHPGLLLGLKETLAEQDFTVFHHSDFTKNLPYMAAFRDRYARTPTPVTGITHSLNTALMPLRYLQLGLAPLLPTDALICTSQAGMQAVQLSFNLMAQRLKALRGLELSLPARLAFIPLGISDARFDLPDRQQARQALKLHPTAPHLLYLGRLSARTKLDLKPLLTALADAFARGFLPELTLVLAGGAEAGELAELQTLAFELGISERIRWFMDFEEARKVQLLSACELFISPSDNLQETFGLSVVEAMAAGCVPLVSDFDGYRELVVHEQTGLLLPTTWSEVPDVLTDLDPFLPLHHPYYLAQGFCVDFQAAISGICGLLAQPERLETMARAARAHAQSFRWSQLIPRIESLWRTLKHEALGSHWKPTDQPHPLFPDNGQAFAHYPTRRLDPTLRLRPSAWGIRQRGLGRVPELGREIRLLLSPDLLLRLIEQLEASSASGITLSALEKALAELQVPGDILNYHVAWLLKQGWLERLD